MNRCELTILMPCLNEAETLAACIEKAKGYFARTGVSGEVLIADNGSTDGSQEIARRLGARVVDVPVRGYGSALRHGIEAAQGRYIVMGDSDDSYDFSKLDFFLEKLRAGYQLVMGNRFQGGIMPNAMPFLHRYLGNPVLSWLGRVFFHSPCGDFHCGLRGFDRDAIRSLKLTMPGMEFASEMVVKATIHKLRITEVPTVLHKDGRSRPPHLRTWRDGWRHLRFLLIFSPRWLFLYPGLACFLIGLAATLWLLPAPRQVGGVTFDIHTLLFASLAVNLGFQAALFWTFAKIFAIGEGLLQPDPLFERLRSFLSLEVGLIVGTILLIAGGVAAGLAFGQWNQVTFGALDPQTVMRRVIPAGMLILLAFQGMFGSFFISLLELRASRPAQAVPATNSTSAVSLTSEV